MQEFVQSVTSVRRFDIAVLQKGCVEGEIAQRSIRGVGESDEVLQLRRVLAEQSDQGGCLRLVQHAQLEEREEEHLGKTQLLEDRRDVERASGGAPGPTIARLLRLSRRSDLRTDDVRLDGEEEDPEKTVLQSSQVVVLLKSHESGTNQTVLVLDKGKQNGSMSIGELLVLLHVGGNEAENVHLDRSRSPYL